MFRRILCLLCVLTLSISIISCSKGKSGADTVDASSDKITLEIASVTPLSGSQAAMGVCIKNGAQLALEEKTKEFDDLGYKLKFSPQDDQADAKVGVTVAQRLVSSDDVVAVIGHFNSGVAIPSSEVYKTVNLAMVSPANTAVQLTERGLLCVNRIVARDDNQGTVAASYSFSDLAAKKSFVIHDKTTYGQGIADEFKKAFEKLGGKVAGYEGITSGEKDFSGVLTKVLAEKPDVVFFGGIYPEGSILIKQMKEKNITAKFIGADGMDSADIIKIAGDSAIGSYYTSTAGDISGTPAGKEFSDKYNTKFGVKPENYSAYGYDAMNVALEGIKKAIQAKNAKPTREEICKSIRTIQGFKGIATNVSFDEKGDNKEASVFIYRFDKAIYPPSTVKSISLKDIN